ncbi:glycosyltransferase family 4 protein [Cryptosporangium aurantiacum]|uniref:Phosphatidylinositol alpha 1,6-mannosyltransferase n=1 Tax=Cryptosporangium aurantiacum TaxID=134849 RepID=A0A1M7QE23_9ACTN|nr:glycosyltransferase family 1 protein [Cryptosporangium aurantiacum]SHN29140.1 phosphatidylinositol alpha 1,6-mannosyltransferase [Cryptosporangium aurantiacum]
MRVAIITESYPPDVNGVAHSVLRTVEHLLARGHEPLVVAPVSTAVARSGLPDIPVVRVPSVGLPGYPSFRVGLPTRRVAAALRRHRPDVVHLASPIALAAQGAFAAARQGVPAVAIYQTDVPGFAGFYKLGAGRAAAWRWLRRVHGVTARTLAPSSVTATELAAHGIGPVHLWPRGVDAVRFDPAKRSDAFRESVGGDVIVGYVGRLAPEKRVDLLEPVTHLPGVKVVIIGDGPAAPALRKQMPRATFLGELVGEDLATAFASLDVFVHTGAHETFCQTVQEAMASGVPVVAPAAGGPVDLVRSGRTGYLVTPSDAGAITVAVRALAEDAALRREFGAAGRAAVAGRSWTAVGDALIGHYQDVIGRGTVAPVERAA